jgi:peroxiredoxin-like protein
MRWPINHPADLPIKPSANNAFHLSPIVCAGSKTAASRARYSVRRLQIIVVIGGTDMNNQLPYFYETEVAWTGERKGALRAPGLPAIEVGAPPEFKGHEGIWSPEHLYVASVNLCFMTTFLAIAEFSKLNFSDFTCRARGTLDKEDGRGFRITEIILKPKLMVEEERDLERAARILEKAERNCLISNSINTRVKLEPEIGCRRVAVPASASDAR